MYFTSCWFISIASSFHTFRLQSCGSISFILWHNCFCLNMSYNHGSFYVAGTSKYIILLSIRSGHLLSIRNFGSCTLAAPIWLIFAFMLLISYPNSYFVWVLCRDLCILSGCLLFCFSCINAFVLRAEPFYGSCYLFPDSIYTFGLELRW